MPEAKTKSKKSAFELAIENNIIANKVKDMLEESYGEITEEIEEALQELHKSEMSIEDKISSYMFVRDKIAEQKEAAIAMKAYYNSHSKQFLETEKARGNNIDALKKRVGMLLERLPGRKVNIGGKNITMVDTTSVTIIDEEKAYATLRPHGLAEYVIELDGHELEALKNSMHAIRMECIDSDGAPVSADGQAIVSHIDPIEKAVQFGVKKYTFAPHSQLMAFVNQRRKDIAEWELENPEPEYPYQPGDEVDADVMDEYTTACLKQRSDKERAFPMAGIDFTIKSYPRGF